MTILYIVAISSGFAFLTYHMAARRSRNPLVFGILGFFFGLFTMIALQIMGKSKAAAADMLKLKALADDGKLMREEFDILKLRLLSSGS